MAWQTPKTNWGQPGQTVPGADDFNRIEGNTLYLKDEVDTQNDALTSHKAAAAPHSGHETPAGAQAKADAAESAAKSYADGVAAGEAGAVQAELDAHKADYTLQVPFATTAGSANAYTVSTDPALPSLVAGVAITVKFHVQNTGASTLNWNSKGAKPIKKANGSNVASGNLKANGVYTLRFDGVNFILQGSDAAGDATPADVLSGKTFSSDQDTELVGTMPNRGGIILTPGATDIAIPAGYHNGQGFVVGDENFIAGNLLKNQSFFGVDGTSTNIPIKEGTIHLAGKSSGAWLGGYTDTSYTMVRTIKLGNLKGRAIIHIRIRTKNTTGRAYSVLYKNGQPYGDEKSTTSTSGYEYSELVDVNPNDTFELYMKTSSSSYPFYFNRFEICINMDLTNLVL